MKLALEAERVKRGWSQTYVAKIAGVSKQTICNIETGRRKPSYDVLIKLLDLFNYNDPRLLFAAADESTDTTL